MHPPADAPVVPDFDGACVAGIVPALVAGRPRPWLPAAATEAAAVVLLVLDGLGWQALEEHRPALPTLAAMEGGPIDTVVPSTTATALTSICTGLAPAQHGILGYRVKVGGSILNVLKWSFPDSHRPPDPFDVQRHSAFMGRDVPAITRAEFRTTGFTSAHLRGARFVGWHTTAALVEHCVRCVAAGERLVYAYYPGVDTIAHEFGLLDPVYARELAFVDRLVDELLDALPARATLLVTSDHGQVHLDAPSWLGLDGLEPFVDVMAGDGRFRYLYAQPGRARELHRAASELAGDLAWVRTRSEVLDEGWIGHGATGSVPGRLGDVVLAARAPVAFVDPAFGVEARLRSGHGSLTAEEMRVPLLAGRGRAG